MATDGKYCSLVQFKQYLLGTIPDPGNPAVFNQAVINTPDDAILSDCLLNAEAAFEQGCGTGFDQQTYSNVYPFQAFSDANGFLHLYARERGPVTAVTAISFRDIMFGASRTWQTITWDASNDIVLPNFNATDTRPLPESWHVMVYPTPAIDPRSTGQILVRWSYTGGFATIPQSLTTLIMRVAAYIYKLREVPAGRVLNAPLGTMQVPADFPPDIQRQIKRWSPIYG